MLKRDKNTLLGMVRDSGFNPEDFEPKEVVISGEAIFGIGFRGTPFKFVVRVSRESFDLFDCAWTKLAPGFAITPWQPKDSYVGIGDVCTLLNRWLINHLKPYLDERVVPDMWGEAQTRAEFANTAFGTAAAEQQFTEPEKEEIKTSVAKARQSIAESFSPTAEQMAAIEAKLNYLIEAVDRLNRFDWKGVLLQTIIGIGTNLTVDTEGGRHLFQLFRVAFAKVLQLAP